MRRNVKRELFLTVAILALLPLLASYFLLNDVLGTVLNLAFNREIPKVLQLSEENLKDLRKLNPAESERYRAQFEALRELDVIYSNEMILKRKLHSTLVTYYGLLFLSALVVALIAALLLSRRITSTYRKATTELLKERERANYLQDMSLWQGVAKRMAHEMKNALTPIEMLISGLPALTAAGSSHVEEVQRVVSEEIGELKRMVGAFSHFAKLPAPSFERLALDQYIDEYVHAYAEAWPGVKMKASLDAAPRVLLDPKLFRHVLGNLVTNAAEANANDIIDFEIALEETKDEASLTITNGGAVVPAEVRDHIFTAHFSTKKDASNMGLGLAIARKIVLEHKGTIECLEHPMGARFQIRLPKVTTEESYVG